MRTYSGHSSASRIKRVVSHKLGARTKQDYQSHLICQLKPVTTLTTFLLAVKSAKFGVPVVHLGDMKVLLDGIPPSEMNTSMTINATAAWLLALYVANANEQGVATADLRGTTQNDILKEYLSRGTFIFSATAIQTNHR